ncbi:MAG: alanine dehydrogenase [Rhodospirillales bacterium]|nr:alanine dehydrogenase [Rhodospirillales bacterium]
MKIGVPKEIKAQEYRVGLTPHGVAELCKHGHTVVVQTDAGKQIGFSDDSYREAGADIAETAVEIFAASEMIVKVKEPQAGECKMLRPGQVLFTYLHLAPDPDQAHLLQKSDCTAIAYETVTNGSGGLPLLAPMSQVAGRLSVQAGAQCLEIYRGGRGVLLGGVPSVAPGKVVIIGGGVVGTNAAHMAVGLRADVTIFDKSISRLEQLDDLFNGQVRTLYASDQAIKEAVLEADLVIGAVLLPGAAAPKIIPKSWLKEMQPGSVLVDVSIDQGGCFETSHATTHDNPTYEVDGIVHYCVANMPGAVARTSTLALTNATLPYVLELADKGVKSAFSDNPCFAEGLNVYKGDITNPAVAEALGESFVAPAQVM